MSERANQEALIHVMVTMSAADRSMTDIEMRAIGSIVKHYPVFASFPTDDLVKVASGTAALLARDDDGLETVLSMVRATLPERLHETAYALAVEIAAVDLSVEQEELRFLQMLRDRLDLDKLAVAAIERSARVRYRQA